MTETLNDWPTVAIPSLEKSRSAGNDRPLEVWSVACSTGEEPYTLAMVLAEHARRKPDFDFNILATDLSTQVLATAKRAVYSEENVADVPLDLRRRYFLRSRKPGANSVKIGPELRSQVRFDTINLKHPQRASRGPMDIAFCRNVLIYFDRETRRRVVMWLAKVLGPGGFLFVGHAEGFQTLKGLPLRRVDSTMYEETE